MSVIRSCQSPDGIFKLVADAKITGHPPYFSLVGRLFKDGLLTQCGTLHEMLVAQWPELTPMAQIHLSSFDGVPMQAVDNAKYWAGFYPKLQGLHVENLQSHLRLFHLTLDEVQGLVDIWSVDPDSSVAEFVESQKPRWMAEAAFCIRTFELRTEIAA